MGYGAAISLGRGTVTARADPRRSGAARAVRRSASPECDAAVRRRDPDQRTAAAQLSR